MSVHREKASKDRHGFIERVFDCFGRDLRPGIPKLEYMYPGGPEARLKRGALRCRHHIQPTVIRTFDQA